MHFIDGDLLWEFTTGLNQHDIFPIHLLLFKPLFHVSIKCWFHNIKSRFAGKKVILLSYPPYLLETGSIQMCITKYVPSSTVWMDGWLDFHGLTKYIPISTVWMDGWMVGLPRHYKIHPIFSRCIKIHFPQKTNALVK